MAALVGVMVSAQCAVPARQTAAEMACRRAMKHRCGTHGRGKGHSCCSGEPVRVEQCTLTKSSPVSEPELVSALLPAVPISERLISTVESFVHDELVLKPPGPP